MNKKIKQTALPKVRFPTFQNAQEWAAVKIGDRDFATLHKGKGLSKSEISPGGKTPCIRYGELYTYYSELITDVQSRTNVPESNLFLSRREDVIIPASGETKIDIATASCVLEDGVALGSDLNVIRSQHNGGFLSYYLNGQLRNKIAEVAQGNAVVHLYPSQLEKLELFLPTREEQNTISSCLSLVDDLIKLENQKLVSLQKYKKGLLQNLFPSLNEKTPRHRFPEFRNNPAWDEKPLWKVASRINKKNKSGSVKRVLTNSAAYGVLDQRDYFDKDIANKNNLNGYTVVEFGDFVYNPRISSIAPVGPISRNRVSKGVMSPLYTVFRFNEDVLDFYEQYFKSFHWHAYLHQISNKGARHDRINVTINEFMEMPLPWPSSDERQKVASFLFSADQLMLICNKKIKMLVKHKKGLMQNLFPSPDEVIG